MRQEEETNLEAALERMSPLMMMTDEDLLQHIASLAYCYATYRKAPLELNDAFQVADNRGLLNTDL